jgi:hypothetical protein
MRNQAEVDAANDRADAEWQAAHDTAVAKHEKPSPRPARVESPYAEGTYLRLVDARQQHAQSERRLLAAICPSIEQKGEKREAEILEQVRPLVAELTRLASELRQVQSDVGRCRDARGVPGVRPSTSERMPALIDPPGLVTAVIGGAQSLLGMAPLTPRRPEAPDPPILTTVPLTRNGGRTGAEV